MGKYFFKFSLKKIDFGDYGNVQCDDFNEFVRDENVDCPSLELSVSINIATQLFKKEIMHFLLGTRMTNRAW